MQLTLVLLVRGTIDYIRPMDVKQWRAPIDL